MQVSSHYYIYNLFGVTHTCRALWRLWWGRSRDVAQLSELDLTSPAQSANQIEMQHPTKSEENQN